MKKEQLEAIVADFDSYENIDIKELMAISNTELLDVIIGCNIEHKKILIKMYHLSGDSIGKKPNISLYKRISEVDSARTAEFMAKVYTKNPSDILVCKAETISEREKELMLKVLENGKLNSVLDDNNIARVISKIMEEKNEDKQEVLADFLCDSEIIKNCYCDQIVDIFRQLNAMEDVKKCKEFIKYIRTLKMRDGETVNSIINKMPKEIIEETIDTSKKEDLEKLVRLLNKTDTSEIETYTSKIEGEGVYFKVKFKSSKNDN